MNTVVEETFEVENNKTTIPASISISSPTTLRKVSSSDHPLESAEVPVE